MRNCGSFPSEDSAIVELAVSQVALSYELETSAEGGFAEFIIGLQTCMLTLGAYYTE
jgi:hypothetical protein